MAVSKPKSALSATDMTSGLRSQIFKLGNRREGDLEFLTLHGTSVGELLGGIKNDIEVEASRDAFLRKVNSIANIVSGDYKFSSASIVGIVSGEAIWDGDSYKRELRRAIFVPEEIRGWHNTQSYTLRCSGELCQAFEDHLKEGDILVICGGTSSIYGWREWTKTYLDLTGPKITRKVKIVRLTSSARGLQPAGEKFAEVINGTRQRDPFGQSKGYLHEDPDDNNNLGHATPEKKNKPRPAVELGKEEGNHYRRMKTTTASGDNKVNGLFWIGLLVLILAIVLVMYLLCKCVCQCQA